MHPLMIRIIKFIACSLFERGVEVLLEEVKKRGKEKMEKEMENLVKGVGGKVADEGRRTTTE